VLGALRSINGLVLCELAHTTFIFTPNLRNLLVCSITSNLCRFSSSKQRPSLPEQQLVTLSKAKKINAEPLERVLVRKPAFAWTEGLHCGRANWSGPPMQEFELQSPAMPDRVDALASNGDADRRSVLNFNSIHGGVAVLPDKHCRRLRVLNLEP
jgi:hypothetical protein